ncbi:MAG TPA: hypothetical protein VN823_18705 [Stellaceae bacterium]|nr:hypothetical protein [Stellaceae bacterium]
MIGRRSLLVLAIAFLGGCTPVYVNSTGPDEYSVRGTSPYGLYGGLVDLSPTESAIAAQASAFCPDGYDKTVETGLNLEDGKYEEWHIKCRKKAASN